MRLIAWLYRTVLGLYIVSREQHIGDLERMLSELVTARDTIEAEITEATRRLLLAQEQRDAATKKQGLWIAHPNTSLTRTESCKPN